MIRHFGKQQIATSRAHQHGMTVLEVVGSLMVAGLFLGMLLPSVNQAYSRFKLAQFKGQALLMAMSKTELLSQGAMSGPFPMEGSESGLTWRIETEANEQRSVPSSAGAPSLRKYYVSIFHETDSLMRIEIERFDKAK